MKDSWNRQEATLRKSTELDDNILMYLEASFYSGIQQVSMHFCNDGFNEETLTELQKDLAVFNIKSELWKQKQGSSIKRKRMN